MRLRAKSFFMVLTAACLVAGAGLTVPAAGAGPAAPEVRILDSLKNNYAPVRFDHAMHASLAGNCAACHHEHGEGKAFRCKGCHSLGPSMFRNSVVQGFSACKTCHGEYDPGNPAMPGLKTAYHKQCFQCHRGMGNIGADPKGCAELCHAKRTDKVARRTGR